MNYLMKYLQVLGIICRDRKPGKKTVQKLMYLIERKGVNLELDYRIHFFGPYSVELDNALHILQNNDTIDIDTSGITHRISIKDEALQEGEGLSIEERKRVISVIDEFGNNSSFELEGITTLDYIARSLQEEGKSDDLKIIEGVKRIKGTKFKEEQLEDYLQILRGLHYLD